MTCARSLFHAFFDDNDGWHVTAVGLLSWRHSTVNCVGGEPGLKRPACAIIINKLLTHGPLRAFCCSQCSTHVRISKIDNGETKTRINLDIRLLFNIPILKCDWVVRRKGCNCRHESFRLDGKWLQDHAIKFARWHSLLLGMGRGFLWLPALFVSAVIMLL